MAKEDSPLNVSQPFLSVETFLYKFWCWFLCLAWIWQIGRECLFFTSAVTAPLKLSFSGFISFNATVSAKKKKSGNCIDLVYGILKIDAIFSGKSFPNVEGKTDHFQINRSCVSFCWMIQKRVKESHAAPCESSVPLLARRDTGTLGRDRFDDDPPRSHDI